MSSEMACRAASLISAGAAKSGNPCERFTAPCFRASRVISRMTDSVNCSALAESMRRAAWAMPDSERFMETPGRGAACRSPTRDSLAKIGVYSESAIATRPRSRCSRGLAINHPVDFGIAQDDLYVIAGFRKRNGLDEFRNLFVTALGFPGGNAIFSCIERGQSVLWRTESAHQSGDVQHAELNVVLRLKKFIARVPHAKLLGQNPPRFREHLHQPDRPGVRFGISLEC